jgi:hypothetical protein
MSFENLEAVLDELCTIRARMKVDGDREEELAKAIKSAVSGAVAETVVGSVMFSIRVQKGRSSLDTAQMTKDGIDLSKYAIEGKPSAVLSVRRVNVLS